MSWTKNREGSRFMKSEKKNGAQSTNIGLISNLLPLIKPHETLCCPLLWLERCRVQFFHQCAAADVLQQGRLYIHFHCALSGVGHRTIILWVRALGSSLWDPQSTVLITNWFNVSILQGLHSLKCSNTAHYLARYILPVGLVPMAFDWDTCSYDKWSSFLTNVYISLKQC